MNTSDELEATAISRPIPSIWCQVCMLPSAFGWNCVMTRICDPTVIVWRGIYLRCHDCGAEDYRGGVTLKT